MTFGEWLVGLVLLAGMTVPPFLGARLAARRGAPDWHGPLAAVATVLVGTTAIVLVGEIVGTVGFFSRVPLAVGGVIAGALLGWWGRGSRPVVEAHEQTGGWGSRVEIGLAVAAVIGLLAQAFTSIAEHARFGISDPDSLHYHLTFAARFVTSGSTTELPIVSAGDAAPYHPANIELLHGLGLAAFRVELLTLVLNVGALAIALLAAAAFGWRERRGAACVGAISLLLAVPVLGREHAGSPHNDVFALAFLLAAVAVLWWERSSMRSSIFIGLAAGLAVGAKLTVAIPVALVVAATIVVSARAGRWTRAAALCGAAALAGGYWYVRNLVLVGSPFPSLVAGPPMPVLDFIDQSVAHYATDVDIIRSVFAPGLRFALGPRAYVVLALAIIAVVVAVASREVLSRLLAAAAMLSAVGYLVTPTTAAGPEGLPLLFRFNVRYLAPALALAFLIATVSPLAKRAGNWWTGAFVALQMITFASAGAWASTSGVRVGATGLACLATGVVASVALARRSRSSPRLLRPSALVTLGVIALVSVGFPLADRYLDRRYERPETPRDELVAFGQDIEDGRTGVVGVPSLQYSFFGPELGGRADYVAERLPNDELRDPRSCLAWIDLLLRRRYDRVVFFRAPGETPRSSEVWTGAIEGARVEIDNENGAVVSLPPSYDSSACDGQ